MNTATRVLYVAAACLLLAACKKQVVQPPPPEQPPPPPPPPPVVDDRYTPEDLDRVECLRKRQVYFDFDRDNVKPEFQEIIDCHAKYLRDRPSARVTLEGNADERGTREYNLGLGERRGNSVSNALAAAAGSSSQITVVSYGEERPVCTESNEDCWWRNRRVEIVYTVR